MAKIPTETKQSFGRLLVFLSTILTIEGNLKYSETLLTFTRAGLEAEGKYDQYKPRMLAAANRYQQALMKFQQGQPSQQGWIKQQIMSLCFEINYDIMSIAQNEGVLVLSGESFNLGSMLGMTSGDE